MNSLSVFCKGHSRGRPVSYIDPCFHAIHRSKATESRLNRSWKQNHWKASRRRDESECFVTLFTFWFCINNHGLSTCWLQIICSISNNFYLGGPAQPPCSGRAIRDECFDNVPDRVLRTQHNAFKSIKTRPWCRISKPRSVKLREEPPDEQHLVGKLTLSITQQHQHHIMHNKLLAAYKKRQGPLNDQLSPIWGAETIFCFCFEWIMTKSHYLRPNPTDTHTHAIPNVELYLCARDASRLLFMRLQRGQRIMSRYLIWEKYIW